MRRVFPLFLLGLAIAIAGAPALAADDPFAGIPNLKFQYYDVEGGSPAEIYRSMQARSPRKGDGVAHAAWQMRTGWQEQRRGSNCRVVNPLSSLSIIVTLPRLVTRDVTPEGLAYWRRTLRGLEVHEAGHARIAHDHRNDFMREGDGAKCGDIQAISTRVQARIQKIQVDYDRETNHGILQTPRADEME